MLHLETEDILKKIPAPLFSALVGAVSFCTTSTILQAETPQGSSSGIPSSQSQIRFEPDAISWQEAQKYIARQDPNQTTILGPDATRTLANLMMISDAVTLDSSNEATMLLILLKMQDALTDPGIHLEYALNIGGSNNFRLTDIKKIDAQNNTITLSNGEHEKTYALTFEKPSYEEGTCKIFIHTVDAESQAAGTGTLQIHIVPEEEDVGQAAVEGEDNSVLVDESKRKRVPMDTTVYLGLKSRYREAGFEKYLTQETIEKVCKTMARIAQLPEESETHAQVVIAMTEFEKEIIEKGLHSTYTIDLGNGVVFQKGSTHPDLTEEGGLKIGENTYELYFKDVNIMNNVLIFGMDVLQPDGSVKEGSFKIIIEREGYKIEEWNFPKEDDEDKHRGEPKYMMAMSGDPYKKISI